MLFKKSKAVIAAMLSAAMAANAMIATMGASAVERETRNKPNAYGEDTYAERFLSLYDDVVTNGVQNGYLSKNGETSSSFGIPYHAVEEVIIEAPDYGHETTSEAMSYLVWVAAMRDNIAKNHADKVKNGVETSQDLAKAWKTMENLIPTQQGHFWDSNETIKATYADEFQDITKYATGECSINGTAANPIYMTFRNAYSNEKGLYLMHWLADVENWYGYGSGTSFTFINTFQRGENESCWETVPHPCVEMLEWGNKGEGGQGLKGIFNGDPEVSKQYAYTNAPDAEDRAIQGVFDANKWGVGDSNVTALAAKMGDELRNNMYDKYYQKIDKNTSWTDGGADKVSSAHYLMNWYTSWGGSLGQYDWIWQIGCSHAHEFYQNPLAAYALIADPDLKAGMKADGAYDDYKTSLKRQLEFYLWLQSSDGPIAGGATNSWNGRYEAYPADVPTFYGMAYVEHPVYADPGSNHWIGNQVWAVQRLAELYYWCKQDSQESIIEIEGMSMADALEQILDKWCVWFVNNTVLTEDGDFYIPSNLDWTGKPDEWTGKPTANSGLSCTITGYGNTDFGCVSSLANTLTYYAKAKGVTIDQIKGFGISDVGGTFNTGEAKVEGVAAGDKIYTTSDDVSAVSLYLAQQLMDRVWYIGRDDIGLTRLDHNGSMARMFAQEVYIPSSYKGGVLPSGDEVKANNNTTFLSIRSQYLDSSKCAGVKTSDEAIKKVKEFQAAYEKDVEKGAKWDSDVSASSTAGRAALEKFTNVGAVDLKYHRFWHAGDELMALGVLADLYPELTPTTPGEEETPETSESKPSGDLTPDYGDVDVDGDVDLIDVITLNKYLMIAEPLSEQGWINADVNIDTFVTPGDALNILRSVVKLIDLPVTTNNN